MIGPRMDTFGELPFGRSIGHVSGVAEHCLLSASGLIWGPSCYTISDLDPFSILLFVRNSMGFGRLEASALAAIRNTSTRAASFSPSVFLSGSSLPMVSTIFLVRTRTFLFDCV